MTSPFNPQPDTDEYVVESPGPNCEGWFPFGEISLIAGSSGSGKTTVMIPLIERASRGENVFSHHTKPRTYKILLRDRSQPSFRRTLGRLKASKELQNNVVRVTPEQQIQNCSDVLKDVLKTKRVDLIFIEGIDMWCHGDASDFNVVCDLLDKLQSVAEEWHVAIIASIGSPKQKANERYELLRDSIYGTVAWGRKTETIMYLRLSDLKNPDSPRECIVSPRQGKSERYLLAFEDGQLVEKAVPTGLPTISLEKVSSPFSDDWDVYFDRLNIGDPVEWDKANGVGSRSTFFRKRKAAVKAGRIHVVDGVHRKAATGSETTGLTPCHDVYQSHRPGPLDNPQVAEST